VPVTAAGPAVGEMSNHVALPLVEPHRWGMPGGSHDWLLCGILSAEGQRAMRTQKEDDMRTALRQAGAIAAVGDERSLRRTLGLAHEIYDALILLPPTQRARRIGLIDAIFGPPAQDSKHKESDL